MLYVLNFAGDLVDGFAARLFNQSSNYGATLDMVTDRGQFSRSFHAVFAQFSRCVSSHHRQLRTIAILLPHHRHTI